MLTGVQRDTLIPTMKVFLKIVAVAVIGVLAAYPPLAGATCPMNTAKACEPGCAMAMGKDCPMPLQASKLGCSENCCENSMQQGVVQTDAKMKAVRAELVAILSPAAATEGKVVANLPADGRVDTGPPRFILFRVIRV
jgi:hypothetical protein